VQSKQASKHNLTQPKKQIIQSAERHNVFKEPGYTVSKWPAAGQGFKFTKWPAVLYFSQILRNRRDPFNPNYHMSINNRQAIQVWRVLDARLRERDPGMWHLEILRSTAGHGFQSSTIVLTI